LPVFVASKGGLCNLSFCRVVSAICATKLGDKALNLQNFLKKLNLYFLSEAVLLNWQPTAKIYLVQTCDPKLLRLLILHTCIEYIFMLCGVFSLLLNNP